MLVCPLCLNNVENTAEFYRKCHMGHDRATGPFRLAAGTMHSLRCPQCVEDETPFDAVQTLTAMWHSGCSCVSPMAPPAANAGQAHSSIPLRLPSNPEQPPSSEEHFQVGWMRGVHASQPPGLQREMFYPPILFETTNTRLATQQRAAVSVLLLGEQRSGKSYLATMAVRNQTWQRHNPPVKVWSFVYTTPADGEKAWEPFADATYALAADKVPPGKVLIPATSLALQHNIRAVFLKPSELAPNNTAAKGKAASGLSGTLSKFLRDATAPREDARREQKNDKTPYRGVIFHDIKGEQARAEYERQVTYRMLKCDKTILVVPVTDLHCFRPKILGNEALKTLAGIDESYDAMQTVRRSIVSLSPVLDRVLVVVTKLDAVRDISLDAGKYPAWNALQKKGVLKDAHKYAESGSLERDVLLELLGDSDGEHALRNLIVHNRAPVFFVWYECGSDAEPKAGGITRMVLEGCLKLPKRHA
jgi:hypothetical protein